MLIVPVAMGPRATPVSRSGPSWSLLPRVQRPSGPAEEQTGRLPGRDLTADPYPDWGSRNFRDNSLILVITGVEAGERGPRRRSAAECPCWLAVGSRRLPVVDRWTSRRLCTGSSRRPPPLPCPPTGDPQELWATAGHCRPLRGSSAGLSAVRAGQGWGSASRRSRIACRSRRRVDVTSRDLTRTRPSPDCAHSWGQLLDESTRNRLLTVPPRGSAEVCGPSTGPPPAVD